MRHSINYSTRKAENSSHMLGQGIKLPKRYSHTKRNNTACGKHGKMVSIVNNLDKRVQLGDPYSCTGRIVSVVIYFNKNYSWEIHIAVFFENIVWE